MANARKLPSGKWNIRIYAGKDKNGKNVYKSITRNTRREAEHEAARFEMRKVKSVDLTIRECMELYIEKKRLSPTTASNYRKILNNSFSGFMEFPVSAITPAIAQRYVDYEAERTTPHGAKISPKTIKNEWALISASVKAETGVVWPVSLPEAVKKLKMYPDPEEVIKRIIGTPVELPCLLAMWLSFTMSEIKGLKCSSVRGGYVFVDQVLVQVGREQVEKAKGKTYYRNRVHELPEYLFDLIRSTPAWARWEQGEDGYIITDSRDLIYRRFRRLTKEYNLSFHDLRHISASIGLNKLMIAPKVMQERGGWATDNVMKTVYSHAFPAIRKESDEKFDKYFLEIINSNM